MECKLGTFLTLFLSAFVPVLCTQYCSSITLGKVTSISCGDHYHCCEGNTRCCLDAGYLPNSAIAGIAVGGAIIIALIVCLTVCFVKSRNKKVAILEQAAETPDFSNDSNPENAGYDQAVDKDEVATRPPPYSASGDNPPEYIKS